MIKASDTNEGFSSEKTFKFHNSQFKCYLYLKVNSTAW